MRILFRLLPFLLVGCGAPTFGARPPSAPDAPIEGARHVTEIFAGADGTELFGQCWIPSSGTPTGLLVVIHGIKDHSSRYRDLAVRLVTEDGLAVCGADLRGHGRSAGRRASESSFDRYLDDLEIMLDRSRARVGRDVPVFLFGHSMGGALATLLVLEREVAVSGVVLSAPALRIRRLPIEIAAVPIVAALSPNLHAFPAPNEDFSSDPDVVRAMGEDPLTYDASHPARLAGAFTDGLERIWARATRFTVPLLVLHGTRDRLTDVRGSAEFVRRATSADKTLRVYDGLFHDLVHEPEREAVIVDVTAWLRQRTRSDSR